MKERQVNVRLTEAEYGELRYWAYRSRKSASDLAREALDRVFADLRTREAEAQLQVPLPLDEPGR